MFKVFKKKPKWFDDYINYDKTYVNHEYDHNLILSQNVKLNINTTQTHVNNNVLLIAGERTGKTSSVVLPNLLQLNRSYVIIDRYESIYKQTATMFKEQGYTVKMFNCFDVQNSMHYNPFAYVECFDDIELIVDYLFLKSKNNKDAFYDNLKKTLVLACCSYLNETKAGGNLKFSDLFNLITMVPDGSLDMKMSELGRKNPQSKAVQRYNVFKAGRINNLCEFVNSILADSKFQFLASKNMQTLLADDELKLSELNSKKQILFINTTVSHDYSDFIVPLLCAQAINAISQQKLEESQHVQFILSEHVDSCLTCYMELIKEVYINSWDEKISFIVTISEINQLESSLYDMWNVIEYCIDVILFLGNTDKETLNWMSNHLNGLLSPSELGKMPMEKCILLIKGLEPFYCDKFKITSHKNFNLLKNYIEGE